MAVLLVRRLVMVGRAPLAALPDTKTSMQCRPHSCPSRVRVSPLYQRAHGRSGVRAGKCEVPELGVPGCRVPEFEIVGYQDHRVSQ